VKPQCSRGESSFLNAKQTRLELDEPAQAALNPKDEQIRSLRNFHSCITPDCQPNLQALGLPACSTDEDTPS